MCGYLTFCFRSLWVWGGVQVHGPYSCRGAQHAKYLGHSWARLCIQNKAGGKRKSELSEAWPEHPAGANSSVAFCMSKLSQQVLLKDRARCCYTSQCQAVSLPSHLCRRSGSKHMDLSHQILSIRARRNPNRQNLGNQP